ncbi:MAG: Hpt domain-containing protein [Pseudomonadota bacterium]|nr:Hpt domain-containing protein [Pseudomonadota bacterium]
MVDERNFTGIDEARLEMLVDVGRGTEFVSGLVRKFGASGGNLIVVLRDALAAGDFDRTRDTAHALKGSASDLGGTWLAELCLRIEQMRNEELQRRDATQLTREVLESFELTQAAMADFLEQRTGSRGG